MIQTGVRISEEMNDDIESIALAVTLSKQEVIRRAIAYFIENNHPALNIGRKMKETRKDVKTGSE